MFVTSYLMLDILLWPFQIFQTPFRASQKDPTGMITAAQLRAARALLGIDQRELAQRSGLSLPTIQRMEASDGVVRGNVDSLMKLVDALAANRIELIGEGATSSTGGRGVRLK
jgi:DNA-binding XRE family transcriptional regulator